MPGIRVRIYRSTYTFQLMNYREYTELERDMELVECVRAQPWITLLSLGCGDAPSISGREYAFLKTLASLFIKRVREGNVQRDISETDLQQIENSFTAWEKSCFYFDLKESSSSLWQQMYICFQTLKTRFSENTESIIKDLSLQLHAPGQVVFQLQESENCEYPFSLKIGYIAKRQGWKTIQPLEDLIKNPFGLCGELQRISGKMLSLAKKYPWLQEHLWQGTIGGELPLDPVESWKLVKEASREANQTDIFYVLPKGWEKKFTSPSVSLEARLHVRDKYSLFSAESLISMRPSLMINGKPVSEQELDALAEQEAGFHLIDGIWTVIDPREIQVMRDRMKKYQNDNLTLFEALQYKAGLKDNDPDGYGVVISQDEWMDAWMDQLVRPEISKNMSIPESVCADLFPYQKAGVAWLNMMERIKLGACLADDMGLGKTLQVLTLLDHHRMISPDSCSLVIVPASLMMNWVKEAQKFTPHLKICLLHGKKEELLKAKMEESDAHLMITTYGLVRSHQYFQEKEWEFLILDEAQAIKNPKVLQTRAVKNLKSKYRIALTGTPIENDLINLWSIFDFLNKGLLGSYNEFKGAVRRMNEREEGYERLHEMIKPFLLRRLKTDKTIIADLPDKFEKTEYVQLTKRQTALYLKEIQNLEYILSDKTIGHIARSGKVLAALTHFKQICNHPDQYVKGESYKPTDSGKFAVLKEICETIRENQECVLIFTQYKEIIPYLVDYLGDVFEARGLSIDGSTPVSKRAEIVDAFNNQTSYIPFIVLSLKAGGTGLNLTKASHVIHFDRWWNPAVENQATDRAYRIGQKQNVLVHKLVCTGTIEEHIDELIESKKELAEQVIGSGADKWITEMSNEELLDLVRLD